MLNIIVPLEWLCKELLPLLATCNYMQVVGCARMSSYFYPPYIYDVKSTDKQIQLKFSFVKPYLI